MTEYRWISDEDCYLAINCPHCGGKTEALKVEPSRSSSYLNKILLCTQCKRFMPAG